MNQPVSRRNWIRIYQILIEIIIQKFRPNKNAVLWDVAQWGSSWNRHFGWNYRLHQLGGKTHRTRKSIICSLKLSWHATRSNCICGPYIFGRLCSEINMLFLPRLLIPLHLLLFLFNVPLQRASATYPQHTSINPSCMSFYFFLQLFIDFKKAYSSVRREV
jgi:hypothetical protein